LVKQKRKVFKILVKNPNFGKKSKFWSKIQILVKNPNFSQKSKFLLKIELLVKKLPKIKLYSPFA